MKYITNIITLRTQQDASGVLERYKPTSIIYDGNVYLYTFAYGETHVSYSYLKMMHIIKDIELDTQEQSQLTMLYKGDIITLDEYRDLLISYIVSDGMDFNFEDENPMSNNEINRYALSPSLLGFQVMQEDETYLQYKFISYESTSKSIVIEGGENKFKLSIDSEDLSLDDLFTIAQQIFIRNIL